MAIRVAGRAGTRLLPLTASLARPVRPALFPPCALSRFASSAPLPSSSEPISPVHSSATPASPHLSAGSPGGGQPDTAMTGRFATLMDSLQARAVHASATLNSLTGYAAIEAIAASNVRLEEACAVAQARVMTARAAYKAGNARRAATQREIAGLLARKDGWGPADLERFTELYRADHSLEAGAGVEAEELAVAEAEHTRLAAALGQGILRRYHEEQVWSDRIRRASTWGTWGLMAVNVVLFLAFQFVAEPWRRRRLVAALAIHDAGAMVDIRASLAAVTAELQSLHTSLYPSPSSSLSSSPPVFPLAVPPSAPSAPTSPLLAPDSFPASHSHPPPPVPWSAQLRDPTQWSRFAVGLCSDQQSGLRTRDVSLLALEGAAVGAALAGFVTWLLASS